MQDSKRDRQQPNTSPADATPPDSDSVLGNVGPGPRDTELNPPEPQAPTSHRKDKRAPAAVTPTGQPAPPDTDNLTLPRGGLIAMRQSGGGLRFRSREIIVYRSGKLVYRQLAPTDAEAASHTRQLPLSQLVELHHLLKQGEFSKFVATGRQNPDAFAYEIAARDGRRLYFIEVFEGSIPESLAPLIRELLSLMRTDQESS